MSDKVYFKVHSEWIKYLDNLNLVMMVWFLLETIFATATAASKNEACFKSGQKWLESNPITTLVLIGDTLCRNKVITLFIVYF